MKKGVDGDKRTLFFVTEGKKMFQPTTYKNDTGSVKTVPIKNVLTAFYKLIALSFQTIEELSSNNGGYKTDAVRVELAKKEVKKK